MENIKLSKNNYELLKKIDLEEMKDNIVFNDKLNTISTNNVKVLEIIISETIACDGMDENQEYCTEYGRKLYALYDEIYFR